MKRKLSRRLLSIAIATVVLIWYIGSGWRFDDTCLYDSKSQQKVVNLAYRVHQHLLELDLTHCLCYGALWTAIQKGSILPWEGDMKFCILNKDLLRFEQEYLIQFFKEKRLYLSYSSGEGYFSVTNTSAPYDIDVKLVVFEALDGDMMGRVGWKRKVLPANCETTPYLQCFPSRLMMEPLPEMNFGAESLPVPREGIEMLKYQYPDSWWLDILPANCR